MYVIMKTLIDPGAKRKGDLLGVRARVYVRIYRMYMWYAYKILIDSLQFFNFCKLVNPVYRVGLQTGLSVNYRVP